MRNMSFALTTAQFRRREKTVTRRLGWANLKPGEIVMGVVKCQGLKKGETVEKLGPIRILSVTREDLWAMALSDCAKEGFPHMTTGEFIEMFSKHNKCDDYATVTRIEYEYA